MGGDGGAGKSLLPTRAGQDSPKVVTIEVTSKGRLNLHKFDAKMQAQLEGLLWSRWHLAEGPDPERAGTAARDRRVSSSSAFED